MVARVCVSARTCTPSLASTAWCSPSLQRRPAVRTVSTAVAAHSPTTNTRFTLQKAAVPRAGGNGSTCVIHAARDAAADISTGYSNVESARNGAHGSSANPRPPYSAAQSE